MDDVIGSPVRRQSDMFGAARWMCVSLASFTLIAIAARAAARTMSTLDIMFYRGWFGIGMVLTIVLFSPGGFRQLRTRHFKFHVARSAVHFIAQFSWLYALTLIPLTRLFAIEFTAPIWTALMAPLFLRERLTRIRVAAAVLGFTGILVVVRPAGLVVDAGSLVALLAAVLFALHYVVTKYITRYDAAFTMLFYMTAIQCVIATILAFPTLRIPDPMAAAWVALLTALGLAAHFALSRAFALADATVVVPMDFLRLPLIAIVGVVLYAEPIDPLVLAGAGIVIVANALNIWGEQRSRSAISA